MLNQLNLLLTTMLKKNNFLLRGATELKRKKEKVRKDKLAKRRVRSSLNKAYSVHNIMKMTRQTLMT